MDSIDYEILKWLQKNARMSIKNLGEKVGLSAPAVADRIKKLEKNEVIKGYKAIINEEKLGKSVKAFIQVSINSNYREKFNNFIRKEKDIIECYHVTGSCCMLLKCYCNNIKDLNKLDEKIQNFGNADTSMVLSTSLKKNFFN